MTRVLVVDDEVPLAGALDRMLTAAGHVVGVAHTGQTGIDLAATWAPDLVVLDLDLPDLDGLVVITTIRGWSSTPVLILSGYQDEERKVAALEAGADDYLVKPFGVRELLARVSVLLRRPGPDSGTGSPALAFDALTVDLATREVRVDGVEARLTPTEWRLLGEFVKHPAKLLTHRHLLHHAWDDSYGAETRESLRVHIRALRRKIGDDATNPRFIRTESGAGYRWIAPPTEAGLPLPAADDPSPPDPDTSEVVHQLGNVLTSLGLRAHEIAADGDADAQSAVHLARVDALLAEAQGLLAWLTRAPSATPGQPGVPPDSA